MKTAWLILLISAFTDGAITAVGALLALLAQSTEVKWTWAVLAASVGPGVVVFLRTIQQALKADSTTAAQLRGIEVVAITKTPGKTEIAGKPEPGQVERSAQHVAPGLPMTERRAP